ncbi:hypothetical protein [Edaphobacillus lindanitolerans]|uniref:Uncharacterized protein n=1 Tax=Edaphobacillus lindanitolerans TaxID=550447 RepID=A0A1U7PMZ8_9BACI|nr:hypothetical protein [Edaphobacillus lindanitolerans]SIT91520.1 hypothetical protein SAMN05428946_2696 [Edaphobacillus lindanitolerans]
MKILTALKIYFLCDEDETIPLEDWFWMALVGATMIGSILLTVIL